MAEHCFDKLAIAHARKNHMSVYAGNPPDYERVGFVAIYLTAKERDAK